MTDRDRLIELLQKGENSFFETGANVLTPKQDYLADHLLANGVIVPPCKVGDTVYVAFSTFYAEYKASKFIYDGAFVWAKLVNEEYEAQDREILRCISFDLNKTIFLDEKECKKCVKY